MASIFGINFGNKIPSTDKFEASIKQLELDFERFTEIEKSDLLLRYNELKDIVNSPEFNSKVKKLKKERFKDTLAFAKEKEFKALKRSRIVKRYNKFLSKGNNEKAEELKSTAEVIKYYELKEYTVSQEFTEIKAHMTDKNRYKNSEEHKLIEEFTSLEKNDDLNWFFKTQNNNSFEELNKWSLTFEEQFSTNTLDKNKWLTGYFWGKTLLNDNYVQANEKQFFTDKNVSTSNNCAQITTKTEKCTGKVWDTAIGFRPQEFNLTSGIINTGQSFRQQYGKFEAKIKFTHNKDAQHIFSLHSETVTPQINICKSGKSSNKSIVGNFWQQNNEVQANEKTLNAPTSTSKYLIYSLEWSKNKLEWKINGSTIHTETNNIPTDPMYLSFSTHFLEEPKNGLPLSFDIDWVKTYKLN
ncbi:glycoside hydrolase family 16 protein [Saccharicrinis aurantiacus]|uniref:glycoside hydrolase family 16 protein n=1 Tax=Saccharicrinis aurantiacus TaxID=1849719 RepID=UPI000838F288|nr:glycoside hydrolase family 16 protein [Saccharicrinis aurantiacus]